MASSVDAPSPVSAVPANGASPWKSAWGRSVRIAAWVTVAVYFLLALILLTVRYAVLPQVDRYRPDIERVASQALGLPVTIENIDARWTGLHPRLIMTQVRLADRSGETALALPRVEAVLSWRSLVVADLRLSQLTIDAPELIVQRMRDGKLYVAGIPVDFDRKDEDGRLNEWLLAQREIAVRGATVRWIDQLREAPPLAVTHVDLMLLNSGHRHRLSVQAKPPDALSSPLTLRADFTHEWFARNAGDPREWQGEAYVLLERTDLAAWRHYFDLPIAIERGGGAVRAWVRFGGGAVHDVTADLALHDVLTRLGPDLPPMDLVSVSGRIAAARNADGHRLRLHGFRLHTGDGARVGPLDFSERYAAARGARAEEGEVKADGLVLHTLADVAERLPLPAVAREILADLRPRGTLRDFSFKWQGPLSAPSTYAVQGRFEGLGLEAQPAIGTVGKFGHGHVGVPGFDNLSGRIDGTHKGGTVQLRGRDATLHFPGMFAEPRLPLQSLEADLKWTPPAGRQPLTVRIERFVFANEDAAGAVAGSYRGGGKGPGVVDLAGRLNRAQANRVHRYLPLSVPERTRTWLQHALTAGRANDTEFRLKGDLYDFPYKRKGSGEFRVAVRFENGRLDYAPTFEGTPSPWLPVEDVKGELVFDRTRLEVRAREARIAGIRFNAVTARFPDLSSHTHVLEVEAQGAGPMQDFVRYFNTSPLAAIVENFTADTRTTGNGRLALSLKLPLADLKASTVNGSLQFQGGDVTLDTWLPTFQRVQGKLDFNEAGISVRGVNATFLGGALKLEGGPRSDGATVIRAEGSATAQGLAQLPGLHVAQRLSGQTRYGATVAVKRGLGTEVRVQSDLAGMAMDLPPPLRKAAAETLPFRLDVLPSAVEKRPAGERGKEDDDVARRDEVRVALGTVVNALFERVRGPSGGMQIVRGSVGVNNAPVLPQEGVIALINVPSFDLDAWLKASELSGPVAGTRAGGESAGMQLPRLDLVALRAGAMQAFGKQLHNVVLGASRSRNVWQVNLDSEQIAGYATWREAGGGQPHGRLTARMAKLIIPRESSAEITGMLESRSAQSLPGVDLIADEVQILGKPLGRLELLADNVQGAWRIQTLQLENTDAVLNGSGLWSPESDGRSKMALHVALDIRDAGRLLGRMGIPGAMRGGVGKIEGDLSWRGAPYALDYPTLNGQLALAVDKGQFLKADAGVAKLLGVLSLQSLPRRITLDFRDVFSEGFPYDTIRSTIQLKNGVASTSDFKMKGVQATVVIDGNSDLARETQQLNVIVVPEINAGSASVLYGLVVNPAVGFGTFLAQLLLREPLAKAFTYQYEISGSWTDPSIAKVGRNGSPPADAASRAGG